MESNILIKYIRDGRVELTTLPIAKQLFKDGLAVPVKDTAKRITLLQGYNKRIFRNNEGNKDVHLE